MSVIASGNTVYTRPVAKVMISIPDQLLERIDARARATRETRSGFLQRLAERDIEAADSRMRDDVRTLLDSIEIEIPGGDAARLIREDRDSH